MRGPLASVARPVRPIANVPDKVMQMAVEARGLSHRFQGRSADVVAIDRVDLVVKAGELVAILGPSGCGKSTLLRIVSGLLAPTAGQVRLAGDTPQAARVEAGIGWLAQDDGLLPWLNV